MIRLLQPKFWTIQTKLTISFCFVLLVSNGVVTYLFYDHTVRQVYNKLSQSTQSTVLQVNKTIDYHIRDMERLSLSVFADPVIQRVLRDPAEDNVQQVANHSEVEFRLLNHSMVWPAVVGIYLFVLDGNIYYQTKGGTPELGYRLEREPWFDLISRNPQEKIHLIPTGWESHTFVNQFQVFSLVRRISDVTVPRMLGYMKIDINMTALSGIVSDIRTFDVSRVAIISSDGSTLYDSAHKVPVDLSGQSFVSRIADKDSGQFTETVDGVSQLVVFHRSAYTGWTVVAMLPISAMNKENKQVRNSLLVLAGIMFVLAGLLAHWISSSVTKRIRRLKRKMAKAERGLFDVSDEQTGFDEVGVLASSFNSMLKSIDNLIRQNYILRLKETESQIRALQAQINPHFLYNTLNVMRGISNHYGVTEVSRMTEVLSDMFRYSIIRGNGYVELSEELEQVRRYLFIQNIRFDQQFDLEIDVPAELLSAPIVRQTLQPIVENAMTYGLESMEKPGKLNIRARRERDRIIVAISDNGIGIEPDRLAAIRAMLSDGADTVEHEAPNRTGTGLGLRNVHQRLQLRFGKTFGIDVASALHEGTTVTLTMPYIEKTDGGGLTDADYGR